MFRSKEEQFWQTKANELEEKLSKESKENQGLRKRVDILTEENNTLKALGGFKRLATNYGLKELKNGARFLCPEATPLRTFTELPDSRFAFTILTGNGSPSFTAMGIVNTKQEALDYAKKVGYILVEG